MAGRVRKGRYSYVMVPNRAVAGAAALARLREAGVDLVAYSGLPAPGGKAQIDLRTWRRRLSATRPSAAWRCSSCRTRRATPPSGSSTWTGTRDWPRNSSPTPCSPGRSGSRTSTCGCATRPTSPPSSGGSRSRPALPLGEREAAPPSIFTPYTVRGVRLANRIIVSPMAQYTAANDGTPTDWHFVHLGARAAGGAALVMTEMTCVAPDARITPWCPGLWNEHHRDTWARIVRFVHEYTPARIGLQLGHPGAKGQSAS